MNSSSRDHATTTDVALDDDFINPFYRDAELPVDATVEQWARALCVAYGAKPDKLIGFPATPAWRSWVGYAEFAVKAAAALQYRPSSAEQVGRASSRDEP